MTKKLMLLFVLAAFITINNLTSAQGIKIGVGGGLTSIQSPDIYTEDDGLGFSSEYHFGAKIKFSVPMVPLTPYGHITYHNFNGETSDLLGSAEVSQSLLQIGAGGEWTLAPGPVSPYLGLELAYNNFGDLDIDSSIFPDEEGAGDSRFGIGLGLGTEITLVPFVNFDVSVKYNWFNLMGKDDGEETVSAITANLLLLFSTL